MCHSYRDLLCLFNKLVNTNTAFSQPNPDKHVFGEVDGREHEED